MSIIRNGILSADLDVPVVLPTLNLDFANSQSLDSRITFSRGSIGTRVNRNGLIETIPANQPRFDFDPISGECRGLLIEESRSNSLLRSEDFTTTWGASAVSVSSNVITAPDGNTTADKLVENNSFSSFKFVSQSVGTISGTYTVSAFFKAGERFRGYLQLLSSGGNATVIFNLRTGTITGGAGTNTITPYGNGWYRVSSTVTFTSATASIYIVVQNDSGTSAYTGDGTSGLYIWGPQVEAGAFPTSYIPTSASTVTRSADNASMTGTNFSSWYNSREGTIQTNIAIPYRAVGGARSFALDNGTVAYMLDFTNTSTVVGLEGLENSGYRSIAFISNSTSIKLNQTTAYSTQPAPSQIICVNGTLNPTGKTYLTTSNYANLRLGTQVNGAGYLNGTIKKLAYYPKALSPAELQYLTQ